ncbi:MAG: M28 family peptidase [Acidobacteriota bacterium]|nr:M28 family peptidase [Acidobacteriota bacterium]
MNHPAKRFQLLRLSFLAVLGLTLGAAAQPVKAPATALPQDLLKAVLNEISGQIPFANEAALAGYVRQRTPQEFEGHFYEAEYLAARLKEYGLDEVRLETIGRNPSRTWWVGQDAELWIKSPEERRLSRQAESPALMTRGCDPGEWEGEAVYLDRRDVPKLKDMDLKGKIVLTPEPAGYFAEAYTKGALGVISWYTPGKSAYDPSQVHFNMSMSKGASKEPAFSFNIWRRLGEELRDKLAYGQKVVLRATAKTAQMPFKFDSVFAVLRGTAPEKKGFLFTAHLFERNIYQGANDNDSACVTITEIARTLARLVKEGRIPRPERSIYFLMSEEGSGTMAFFGQYPEMADRIFGVVNMDMVGEDLDKSQAFFNIEMPTYKKMTFLEGVIRNFAEYVFRTNIEMYAHHAQSAWLTFPEPIVDKNGSYQPFRYTVSPYVGGSDHGVFLMADADIPAFSFNVWPDYWYHTDRDRPDKSDPTQLKRVAFIGAASSLASCLGREDVLERVIRIAFEDRAAFVQATLARVREDISAVDKADGGKAFRAGQAMVEQAADLSRAALLRIRDLTAGKPKSDAYLTGMLGSLEAMKAAALEQVKGYARTAAGFKGYAAEPGKPSAEEIRLRSIVPVKTAPLKLSEMGPYTKLSEALSSDRALMMDIFQNYGYEYFMQLYFAADGRTDLAKIRDRLGLEFKPIDAAAILKHVQALEKVGLIKLAAR